MTDSNPKHFFHCKSTLPLLLVLRVPSSTAVNNKSALLVSLAKIKYLFMSRFFLSTLLLLHGLHVLLAAVANNKSAISTPEQNVFT